MLFKFIRRLFKRMPKKPNIIILLADDLGLNQVGYKGAPIVQTPNIDALASNGLQLDRFYTGSSQCSPTRMTILTGRAGPRSALYRPFYKMRLQEKTIAQTLKVAGYRSKHFGKWHLGGMRGGVGFPLLPTDTHSPDKFGFDEFIGNTCNMVTNTQMGDHEGNITENNGDHSDAIAGHVNTWLDEVSQTGQPFFANVWFSAPHGPFSGFTDNSIISLASDRAPYEGLGLSEVNVHQFAILRALDRAIGTIRQKLRDLGIENDTVVWFCSDNGGIISVDPDAVGELNGEKDRLYEGGIRVPCVVEWPGTITPGNSDQLAYTSDIAPTLCALADANPDTLGSPLDGRDISCTLLYGEKTEPRALPYFTVSNPVRSWAALIPHPGALVSDKWKIITGEVCGEVTWELYNLEADPNETTDLAAARPDVVAEMASLYWDWFASVRKSINGLDYSEKRVVGTYPFAEHAFNEPIYAQYVAAWQTRPEYEVSYAQSLIPDEPGDAFYEPYCF